MKLYSVIGVMLGTLKVCLVKRTNGVKDMIILTEISKTSGYIVMLRRSVSVSPSDSVVCTRRLRYESKPWKINC